MRARVRAGVATALAVVVLLGLAVEARQVVRTDRLVRGDAARTTADELLRRFDCVRDALEALPAVPLFVPDGPVDPEQWRQRITEFAFPEIPVTHDPHFAAQFVTVVPAEPGSPGDCLGVRLEVLPVVPTVTEPAGPPDPL